MRIGDPTSGLWLVLALTALLALIVGDRIRRQRLELLKIASASRHLEVVAWFGCLTLLVFSFMRPQGEPTMQKRQVPQTNLVFAVDVSQSMLSDDVQPSRLERARREILDLIENLKGERVALVIFAGTAFIQTPLTNDYASLKTFIALIDPAFAPTTGSDLTVGLAKSFEALGVAREELDSLNPESARRGSGIILFSDGESFGEEPTAAIAFAKSASIPVFAYAIGTEVGGPIRFERGLKRDRQGEVVITKANPSLLSRITSETGGFSVRSVPGDEDTRAILERALPSIGSARGDEQLLETYREYFQIPLLIAALVIAWIVRRSPI